ncbi:MAG: hypothetical protein PHP10_03645 [Candidatus Omnitrophica bacterium]|nr:hypothetical protein [Candidatus Omnitrophota bacterium]
MSVKTIQIQGIDQLHVRGKSLWATARLIIRERPSGSGWRGPNRYLYLVYRDGHKIKEHYIAKLADEKI